MIYLCKNFGMLRSALALFLLPLLFARCSTNNVTVDDSLKTYFDSAGVSGTFGLFDNGQGHFTIYNLKRFRDSAYAPGETFNILQSLIALQTGVAANENSAFGGVSLAAIFKGSGGNIGTLSLAGQIGKDTLKKWVDSLHYGNRDISDIVDSEDILGRLKITADEQLGLTKRLYFDQLPFFRRPQQITRSLFNKEQNSNYQLTYKTGSRRENGKTVAWILGWEEENKHPYFFVLNFETSDPNLNVPVVGLQVVKKILTPMGFFAGKK
jgi:beta-lactamase class D